MKNIFFSLCNYNYRYKRKSIEHSIKGSELYAATPRVYQGQ